MFRCLTRVFLLTIAVVALANQAWGSCSQFGHSCFGAHGKRSGGQYDNLMAAAAAGGPYPVANQVPELDPRQEEEQQQRVPFDDGAVIRHLLAILGHRSRQRSSSNIPAFNYLK
ncbi:uncharacterized protein [Panulirus ornatus]|uniref:uncharacterized protein n=1 Tax=Panulirus ornatus TaxID=150431 RepID=UPI003A8B817B